MVGRGPAAVLAPRCGTTSTCRPTRVPERVLGSARDAGRGVVPGRAAQLRRARLPRRKDDDLRDPVRVGESRDAGSCGLGAAARRDGSGAGRAGRAAASSPGDRVVAYLPQRARDVAAFLATASLGAVWSSCSPDFGAQSVIDRFAQIEPKVLLATDAYDYGGKTYDKSDVVEQLREELRRRARRPAQRVVRRRRTPSSSSSACRSTTRCGSCTRPGTTGLPKAIVQGQGGILLEHLKKMHLHLNAQEGDRVFWFTTTGWMMWNFLVGVLLTPASIVTLRRQPGLPGHGPAVGPRRGDGDDRVRHGRRVHPRVHEGGRQARRGPRPLAAEVRRLDRLAAVARGLRVGLRPARAGVAVLDVAAARTSAPRSSAARRWKPVWEGELQGRALGLRRRRRSTRTANSVVEEVGELVITQPMPSMPLYLWGDEDGSRLRESYFDDLPGRLAPRRLDPHHRPRHRRHLRPLRLDDQPRRHPHGHRRDLRAPPCPSTPSPTRWSSTSTTGCRCSSSSDGELTDDVVELKTAHPRELLPAPRPVARSSASTRSRARCRARCSRSRSRSSSRARDPDKAASRESLANPEAFDWFVEFARERT